MARASKTRDCLLMETELQMRRKTVFPLIAAIMALMTGVMIVPGSAGHAELPAPGAAAFQRRCATCHSLTGNSIGPTLGGVVGRKAASAAQYNYSAALVGAHITWTPKQLDAFLAAPQRVVPGTKMLVQTPDAMERKAITRFLAKTK